MTVLAGALLVLAQACSAEPGGVRPHGYSSAASTTTDGGTLTGGTLTGGTLTGGTLTGGTLTGGTLTGGGGTGNVPLPTGTDPAALIPARIRRLSNAEYDASTAQLLGTSQRLAQDFAPDARQAGYTVNDAQRVDAVLVKQLFAAAETLAAEARPRFAELAPCATPETPEVCASAFIESFGAKAYRRPIDADEAAGLLEVFRAGAEGTSYDDGVELVIRALLQSAGFLYLTELGSGAPDENGSVTLTSHELASALSYLVTAAPPDQTLLDAANSGSLSSPEERVAQVLRLRSASQVASDTRLVRLLREWLGTDRIETTAKDTNIYPLFDTVKAGMVAESQSFLGAVLNETKGSVSALLGSDWTVTSDADLLGLYDASAGADGKATLPARRGILNQGAFLAVHAHAHESTPVLRGVAIARRVACMEVPSPATLNISVVPPAPDPTLTTRQRFEVHSADPGCATCHDFIDPFGNAFEQFDGMGQYRVTEGANQTPVDSTTTIAVGADYDGSYADSNALAVALANSAEVRACFARQVFRAITARTDSSTRAAENAFVTEIESLPLEEQGNLIDTLVNYVKSPIFTHRRTL